MGSKKTILVEELEYITYCIIFECIMQ